MLFPPDNQENDCVQQDRLGDRQRNNTCNAPDRSHVTLQVGAQTQAKPSRAGRTQLEGKCERAKKEGHKPRLRVGTKPREIKRGPNDGSDLDC
jgi:hypothetical protein